MLQYTGRVAWEVLKGAVMEAINAIVGFISWLWDSLQGIWNNIVAWATGISQSATDAGSNFINNITSFFIQLPGLIWNFLLFTLTFVLNFVTQLRERARQAGSNFDHVRFDGF
jgi:predicted PurR-regulated permease PerM